MGGERQELGRYGETLAAEFFVRKGWRELARNLRFRQGEIDLLMEDGETVVVVEVKTQVSADFSHPIFKIDWTKRRTLSLLAEVIAARYPDRMVRVDAATVVCFSPGAPAAVTHWENIVE